MVEILPVSPGFAYMQIAGCEIEYCLKNYAVVMAENNCFINRMNSL